MPLNLSYLLATAIIYYIYNSTVFIYQVWSDHPSINPAFSYLPTQCQHQYELQIYAYPYSYRYPLTRNILTCLTPVCDSFYFSIYNKNLLTCLDISIIR